jgi:hypothetical protein
MVIHFRASGAISFAQTMMSARKSDCKPNASEAFGYASNMAWFEPVKFQNQLLTAI